MIINCEECGKRYRIDENKIKGERARLKCKACGNIMEVTRPQPKDKPERLPDFVDTLPPMSGAESQRDEVPGNTESSFAEEKTMEWTAETLTKEKGQRPGGLSIGLKLLIMFVGFVVVMGSVLTFVYLKYVPSLMADQISLRTYSISRSFRFS